MIEAHGAGTPLGDPIEIAALVEAFEGSAESRGYCALGSVKSNIGHVDAAAGIAGLIKAVLAVRHREIRPTVHFKHGELSPRPRQHSLFREQRPSGNPAGRVALPRGRQFVRDRRHERPRDPGGAPARDRPAFSNAAMRVWVREEWQTAFQRSVEEKRSFLIMARIEDYPLPRMLRHRLCIDLFADFASGTNALIPNFNRDGVAAQRSGRPIVQPTLPTTEIPSGAEIYVTSHLFACTHRCA